MQIDTAEAPTPARYEFSPARPKRLQAALNEAFGIELLYRKNMHQITVRAAIPDLPA